VDPAEERRVPHLDGDEQRLVQREEHRNLDDDRQAADLWSDSNIRTLDRLALMRMLESKDHQQT
jgi:hypothetical protein